MMSWIAALIWIGGIGSVYEAMRDSGSGRLRAFLEGLTWPIGLGQMLAERSLEHLKSHRE